EVEAVRPVTSLHDGPSSPAPEPVTSGPALPPLSPDSATPDSESPVPEIQGPLESAETQVSPTPYIPQASSNTFPWFVFPVAGKVWWNDWFNPDGLRPMRIHHGQDIFAPKMTPLVAVFDGVVWLRPASRPGGHNMLYLFGDNGLQARYMHINNDTPGTDDGNGGWETAY